MEYITNFFSSTVKSTHTPRTQLFDELCSNRKRVCITKELLNYIDLHNLQDDDDVNSVILNDALAAYFKRKVGQTLTYYEMQELIDLDKPFNPEIGFLTPLKLSDDLCRFLEIEPNSQLSRIDVTRKLRAYIDAHKLQVENDRQKFILDESLADLFGRETEQHMTYYEMQTLLTTHLAFE